MPLDKTAALCEVMFPWAYTAELWQEVEPLVQLTHVLLVIDDTTVDKPYARYEPDFVNSYSSSANLLFISIS